MRSQTLARTSAADIGKSAIAGCIAGLASTWIMTRFQILMTRLQDREQESERGHDPQKQSEPATQILARRIYETVSGRPLEEDRQQLAGQLVHYGYGILMGAVYGVIAELMPKATTGRGTAYGAVLWVVGDEVAVPALELSPPPNEFPASVHANALAAHLVYGLSLDLIRTGVLKMIEQGQEQAPRPEPPPREAPLTPADRRALEEVAL